MCAVHVGSNARGTNDIRSEVLAGLINTFSRKPSKRIGGLEEHDDEEEGTDGSAVRTGRDPHFFVACRIRRAGGTSPRTCLKC